MKDLDQSITANKQQSELLRVDKTQLEEEYREHVRHRAQIELDVKALTADQEHLQQAKAQYEAELQEITDSIAEREAELSELLPEYNQKKEEEAKLKSQLEEAEAARQRLYAKQGRNTQFRNKRERDEWLRREIRECQETLGKRKVIMDGLETETTELEAEVARVETEIESIRGKLDGRSGTLEEIAEGVAARKDDRNRLVDERKELWREDAKLDSLVESSRQELDKAERALSYTMDQNTSRGLAAVRRIEQKLNLQGCYGTLVELMDVQENFRTAVEVTAGQSLFHYVVDNDDTATTVLQHLQREKAGRITFMPLNRLKPRLGAFPGTKDALPMLDYIEYDETYAKAFEQVFGKTIVCPDLNVASQYARSHGLSAITLAGDRADKKGALTGGYHDPRRSRLEAVKAVKKWRETYEKQKREAMEIKRRIERKDQEVTNAVGELQKAEAKRGQLENSYGPLRAKLQGLVGTVGQLKDTLERKRKSRENVEASLKSLGEQLEAYQAEISSEFKKSLTSAEEARLEELTGTVQELRKTLSVVALERAEKESRKSIIEVELRENLRMRLDQLKGQSMDNLETTGSGGRRSDLKESQGELKRIGKSIDRVKTRLDEVDQELDEAKKQLEDLERQKAELQTAQQEEARNIERQKKKIERSMAKRALLTDKAQECSRNIRDLGVLPEEAFEKFERLASNQVRPQKATFGCAMRASNLGNKRQLLMHPCFFFKHAPLIRSEDM